MGFKLRLNLFYQTCHEAVYEAYAQFYRERRTRLTDNGDDFYRFDIREKKQDWVVVRHPFGRCWEEWQKVQEFTSRFLRCTNLLLFVYDGDFWGYQLCSKGKVIDRFIQRDDDDGYNWFLGDAAPGNPELLADLFPWLNFEEVALYLQKLPSYEIPGDYMEIRNRLNIRVRPEDLFCRFDECAILNFLRILRVLVEIRSEENEHLDVVTFPSPVWKSFWLEGRQTHSDAIGRNERS